MLPEREQKPSGVCRTCDDHRHPGASVDAGGVQGVTDMPRCVPQSSVEGHRDTIDTVDEPVNPWIPAQHTMMSSGTGHAPLRLCK